MTLSIEEPLECPADPNYSGLETVLTAENVKDFLHSNQQVRYITINATSLKEFPMKTLLSIISKNSSILKLHVHSKLTYVTMDDIKRFTSKHRFIVDLDLNGYVFTSDDVIFIIHQLNSLKRISVRVKRPI